jgi:hypothetical protein
LSVVGLSLAGFDCFALTAAMPNNPAAAAVIAPAASRVNPASGMSAAPPAGPGRMVEDIRDIRGPRHIPSPWFWPLWLAGGTALAAVLYAAWRWNRRRQLVRAKRPFEIALEQLELARKLMRPESAREFSIAVSEAARNYIEARFQVRAARRTTEEFLYDLLDPSDALLGGHRALLADFLHHCDLAKFARWILSIDEMESMLQSARTFVMETGEPFGTPNTKPVAPATVHQGQNI